MGNVELERMAEEERYPPPLWREFDRILEDMNRRFRELADNLSSQGYLPAPGFEQRLLPALRGEFSVDVMEEDSEVIIAADLPGMKKEEITITLIDPRTLDIRTQRGERREETTEEFYMRERHRGEMERYISLPSEVTSEGATSTFINGVLEIRLKKAKTGEEKKIEIT